MKNTFFQSMAWLHTWGGLIFGWLLFAIFLTGSLSVFDREITHWMQSDLHAAPVSVPEAVNLARDYLRDKVPGSDRWIVVPPTARNPGLQVYWQEGTGFPGQTLDPATGSDTPRETEGGHFLVHFHFELNAGLVGMWIVAAVAMAMLVALVSGIIIHRRIFRDFFTFRPRAAAQRAWLDAHNALGVLTLPFLLMITFTGLVIVAYIYMPAGIQLLYEGDTEAFLREALPHVDRERADEAAPLLPLGTFAERAKAAFEGSPVWYMEVDHPGDKNAVVTAVALGDDRLALSSRQIQFDGVTGEVLQDSMPLKPAALTQRVLSGLHFGQFGGYPLQWLYFLSGLAGATMIATGLVLFTVKRRRLHESQSDVSGSFLRFAESMNVTAVAGPVLACLAYLWSNRLLPADLSERAAWEIGGFFAAWLLSLLHCLVRAPLRAWYEQIACAAFLCLALPLLNLLTTDRHLLASLFEDDWRLAGVDLTVFTLGILFACLAACLGGKHTPAADQARPVKWWEYAD